MPSSLNCTVSGGATALGMVAMSDYLDMDTSLQDGLLLGNYSTSDFEVIADKAEQGFNITISDIFGIVRCSFIAYSFRRPTVH